MAKRQAEQVKQAEAPAEYRVIGSFSNGEGAPRDAMSKHRLWLVGEQYEGQQAKELLAAGLIEEVPAGTFKSEG